MTAPITPDERAAMRERHTPSRGAVQRGVAALTDIPRLLDALDTAEAEVARLREEAARPAPVWDEDTVTEAVASILRDYPSGYAADRCPCGWVYTGLDGDIGQHTALHVLAVVREHLPVFAADIDGLASEIFEHSHEPSLPDDQGGMEEARSRAIHYFQKYVEQGWSRAEVQAEALRDAAEAARRCWTGGTNLPDPEDPEVAHSFDRWLDARADRLAPKGA